MIVTESLIFNENISIEEVCHDNASFRQYTNQIFDYLLKDIGMHDAVGIMEWSEEELRALYDQGVCGMDAINVLKKLEDAEYDFMSRKFQKPSFVKESLEKVLKSKAADEREADIMMKLIDLKRNRRRMERSSSQHGYMTPGVKQMLDRINFLIASYEDALENGAPLPKEIDY